MNDEDVGREVDDVIIYYLHDILRIHITAVSREECVRIFPVIERNRGRQPLTTINYNRDRPEHRRSFQVMSSTTA